jgi:hypothetical protein
MAEGKLSVKSVNDLISLWVYLMGRRKAFCEECEWINISMGLPHGEKESFL